MTHQRLTNLLLTIVLVGGSSSLAVGQAAEQGVTPFGERVAPIPMFQWDLLDTSNRLIGLRSMANLHGYERSEQFQYDVQAIRTRIEQLVALGGPTVPPPDRLPAILASLLREYEINRDYFAAFYFDNVRSAYRVHPGADPKLANMYPPDVAAHILSLYLLVAARDPGLAERMARTSYIWPFCSSRALQIGHPGISTDRVHPDRLLSQLEQFKAKGFSPQFLMEYAQRNAPARPLTPEDEVLWRQRGIPNAVIRAAGQPAVLPE